tara:strand:- start:276 stop:461 length:186 start_codon:yes stop_codon:yes gene_type:complete
MSDIKTITQELSDASLDLTNAINTINENLDGIADYDSHNEVKAILTKILEKIDEVVNKINT